MTFCAQNSWRGRAERLSLQKGGARQEKEGERGELIDQPSGLVLSALKAYPS